MLEERIYIDVECYKDYFLLSALQHNTGKVVHFEMYEGKQLNLRGIRSLMSTKQTISFNGLGYDLPVIVAACSGYNNQALKNLSDRIITSGQPIWAICRDQELNVPSNWDHIDLIEVAPGQASLKIYGGRLNAPKLQDLPIHPSDSITPELRELMRTYCINDLETTKLLCDKLEKEIVLRETMGAQYGMDLRSKSDAQIAETVIKSELYKKTRKNYKKPLLPKDFSFKYKDPEIVNFKSEYLKGLFERILKTRFKVGSNGSVLMPEWLKNEKVMVDGVRYQMGIGGLHSCEKSQYVVPNDDELLFEQDVASYYPNIIMQQGLAPDSLGKPFLDVYETIVERRLASKKRAQEIAKEIAALKFKLAKLTV